MCFDGREASNFGALVVRIVNAIATRCASDAVGIGFLRAVGRYNTKVSGFLVFWYFVERDKHHCVCSG